MTRPALYIRLIFATVAAMASAVFVWIYTPTAMGVFRARIGKDFIGFPGATQAVADLRWYPVLIPVILLMSGVFVIHRWKSSAAFELVVSSLWLFAFLWLVYCLLVCILPEIAMITPLHGPS
jgi:hypothetical protein